MGNRTSSIVIAPACPANHRALDHFHCMGRAPIGGRLPWCYRSDSNLPVTGGDIFVFSNLWALVQGNPSRPR